MTRILVLSDGYPGDLTHGRHLRDFYICRELCRDFECFLVELSPQQGALPDPDPIGFAGITSLDPRPRKRDSFWRFFRLSNAHYVERSSPHWFAANMARIRELANHLGTDGVLNLDSKFSEFSARLAGPSVVDYPDSAVLAIDRKLQNSRRRLSIRESAGLRISRLRHRQRDRALLPRHTLVTTISASDKASFGDYDERLGDRVIVVPNGVAEAAQKAAERRSSPGRTIVFWGNLDFPPNWTAVSYFYEQVFIPYLATKDIDWYIVGGGASDRIKAMGAHPRVHLSGFVDDLFAYVANMGAMINPMIEGGGMKNKVLEAFALGMPVVTTSMGVDAIDGQDREHFLVADDPAQFAQAVESALSDRPEIERMTRNATQLVTDRYLWTAIGRQYKSVIEKMLAAGAGS